MAKKEEHKRFKKLKAEIVNGTVAATAGKFGRALEAAMAVVEPAEKVIALQELVRDTDAWLEKTRADVLYVNYSKRNDDGSVREMAEWIGTAFISPIAKLIVGSLRHKKLCALYAPFFDEMEFIRNKAAGEIGANISAKFDTIIASPRYADIQDKFPELRDDFARAALDVITRKSPPPAPKGRPSP